MNIVLHLVVSWFLLALYVLNSTFNLYKEKEYYSEKNYREYFFNLLIVLVLLLILNLIDKMNEFLIETDKKIIQLGTRVEDMI